MSTPFRECAQATQRLFRAVTALERKAAVLRIPPLEGREWFEVLRQGLPQEHAYDLVYRHALAIDDTGNRLAMGSTTGSLWTTANGGDSWDTVSTHLPPVYCVRFGV